MTEEVTIFFNKTAVLQNCISNFTQVIFEFYIMTQFKNGLPYSTKHINLKQETSIDPLFQNYSANSTLCNTCKTMYVDLTKHFKTMSSNDGKNENSMCMDLVDLYNYTRIAWSKGYKCNYREIDELNLFLISGTFTAATVGFYILMRIFNKKEEFRVLKMRNIIYFILISYWYIRNK